MDVLERGGKSRGLMPQQTVCYILTALMSHAREWSAAPMVLHTPRPIQNIQAVRRHETELTALR